MHDMRAIYVLYDNMGRSRDVIEFMEIVVYHNIPYDNVRQFYCDSHDQDERYIRFLSSWSCDVFSSMGVTCE